VQRTATAKAEARARFDLDCPDVKGEVINREQFEPLAFRGPVLARYAIGVAGCGRRDRRCAVFGEWRPVRRVR
jgi:hypothetical protein